MGNFTTKILLTGAAAIVAASAGAEIAFNAVVSFPTENAGVYQFNTKEYDPKLVKNQIFASGGGIAYDDGYYYGVRVETIMGITAVEQKSYKMSDWSVDETYSGNIVDIATANTFDADLGLAVGCYYNEDGETFRFCTINVPYWGKTKISDLPNPWGACGFNKDGVLYAVESTTGKLFTVDLGNGAMTLVGETGLINESITGGFIDKESSTMIYAIKSEAATALYSINLATAAATKLYDLENKEQLGGFFIPAKEYAANVPGLYSSKPSISFDGTKLEGKFYYYPPRNTYDGNKAEGEVTYHIYANGKEIQTGTTTYGLNRQTANITVDAPGYYCFSIAFSNEAGEGPRQRADAKYLGPDTPKAPTANYTPLSYADGKVTVRWGAVSSGVHGGNINTSDRVYRVTRYPEGKVISAADLKTTSIVDEIEMPAARTEYWYTVEAVDGEKVSLPYTTPKFELGPIAPPYQTEFANSTDFFGYSTLNGSTDNKTWSYDSDKCVKVSTSSKPADNYLLLPQLKVKPGESYTVTIQARSYGSNYTEEFEVVSGSKPTVEGLNQTVIEKSQVSMTSTTDKWTTFTGTLNAPAEGPCYMAVHATTPTNGGYLYIQSITISKGMSEGAPAAVTNLKATPAANGDHSVVLEFNLPDKNLGDDALTEITKVEIMRDGEALNTLTSDLTPGAAVSYTDSENVAAGNHTYTVICSNSIGEGTEASTSVFVGFSAPVEVESVSMSEPAEGHVLATWSPVTKDVDGRALSAKDVKYNVYKYYAGETYPVAENVEGTSIVYDAFKEFEGFDDQRFVQTLVEAVTEGGVSKIKPSDLTPIGKPYSAPWAESFADCKVSSIFGNQIVKGSDKWTMVPSDDFGTTPADNDGGMMYFEAYGGGICSLLTGKIDLGDVVEPAFLMQVFHYAGSSPNENLIEVEVRPSYATEFTKVYSSTLMELGNPGEWVKVTVPLADYAGDVVQLRMTATNKTYAMTHLDDMRVTSNAPYNMAITNVSAPGSVDPGTPFNIVAEIENAGTERAIGYKVNLYLDDELIESKKGAELMPEEKATVKFEQEFSVFEVATHSYNVEIEYGPDMFMGDNTWNMEVTVRSNSLPVVTDLKAEPHADGALVSWTAPSAQVKTAVTENFDAPAFSWATQIEGWTFLDLDKGTIGGIGNKQLPVNGRQSFFVFNNTLPALQAGNVASFNAHSGTQYLCSMYSAKGGEPVQSDDWAISPELTGDPQMISMYASSFPSDPDQPQYLETFQILYSDTDTDPENFKLIEEFANIPAQWLKYSAYLPEGAKYFAIRCVSNYQYMLFVDDVTFTSKNSPLVTLTPSGYNVYRDGQKLNEEAVTATNYVDTTVGKEKDAADIVKYHVTALYDEGESLPSEYVEFDASTSGVNIINGETLTIGTTSGAIVVTGAEGLSVEVFSTEGQAIATVEGKDVTKINVTAGLYIVKAGNTSAKVMVR
ncbi:MAG: choice-of-anchor J domain-containing protein [Muribaculaceae bacterium]|nr:choice-of-anchor J domain-containing protein [Muribaculaceae bacterium]